MNRFVISLLLIIAAGLLLPQDAEARKYRELEASYEVAAADLRIPRRGQGTLRVETCPDCKKLRFKLTANARAFVNQQPISIQQFRNLAIANKAPAYVFYKPGTFEITRLVLDIPGFK
ncbi:MAG: hypothetical protein KJO85_10315 [Gammaproteobacteria bacterium]|nr:hypothetical protein [Gammaproteobacteria bacterium]